ncbi:MAG: hypothetical protein ABFS42_04380 [Candidatus Krumholzibacteriota bacterium]
MAPKTAINNETICDLSGRALDRSAVALLKAIDKLLTVGAYYSPEHGQYKVVSEKSCAQIVASIGPGRVMAIEITASGMMIRSQLVDPHHRNVRLLHDLLVPLNIARFEISADLTPADLRQAISALQEHKQNLGNTTGFQEIKIENLPPTVSTASKSVVRDNGEEASNWLDGLLGNDSGNQNDSSPDEFLTESEKLARQFLEVVAEILDNLEKDGGGEEGSAPHPDSTPENLRALREALQRLVEVNPDPVDLARLIEHAKRALDLSRDPRSVDLVFSLLKKEFASGGDWKNKARENSGNKPKNQYKLSLEQLGREVSGLEAAAEEPADPGPTSLSSYLGICFHLLAGDPSETLETALELTLKQAIENVGVSRLDLNLCSAAVAEAALKNNQVALDRVLPAFCDPLHDSRPDYLVKFWARLWEALDPERRALVWPHLVNDLLRGFGGLPVETVQPLWLAAGQLDSRDAFKQVSRLESMSAVREKAGCPGLMALPLEQMYPVHLALVKSSLASTHGPRLHEQLRRHPPNDLVDILMKSLDEYDAAHNGFYLSLIKEIGGDSISPGLRRQAARLIVDALSELHPSDRNEPWVGKALGWIGKLDPDLALPLLTRVRDEKKYFFFRAWPRECRRMAENVIEAAASVAGGKGKG